jgi:DNA-binding GntR family transcriptional regulator
MAGDPRVSERVYRDIKQAILSGEFRLRQRLDIDELARALRASATPVRQALAILAAERLVSVQAARGYCVAFWSERELAELYEWRSHLAGLAVASYSPQPSPASTQRRTHAEAFLLAMQQLARDANAEVRRAAESADERLHAALKAEPHALADTDKETVRLMRALSDERPALQQALRRSFKRRLANAGEIRAKAYALALPNNG